MDPDIDIVFDYYKHLFPDFTVHHALVYKLLWRVEPISGEDIAEQTGVSKTTVYKVLRDLLMIGLVNKTNFKPVGFYAENPVKSYNSHLKKTLTKLEKGAEKLEALLENSSGLSGEIYLVKRDGGQQKLVMKQTRGLLSEAGQLLLIKKAAEEQLKEIDKQKLRQYVTCK